MVATIVPVTSVPNPPRCPSWKIQISAPKVAVRDNTLSTSAFRGSTTEPVNRNSSAKVTIAMMASTKGSLSTMPSTASRSSCAPPPIFTVVSPGPGRAWMASS